MSLIDRSPFTTPAGGEGRHVHVDGLRVVTRNDGRCLDLVSSPSSSYLLPDLADFSLLQRRGDFDGTLFLTIGATSVGVVSTADSVAGQQWRKWFGGVPGLGYDDFALDRRDLSQGAVSLPLIGLIGEPPSVLDAALPRNPEEAVVAVKLVDVTPQAERLRPSGVANVAQMAQRISKLSQLTDEQLAGIFKVERETFARWKNGALGNPRAASRRRLGLLLQLFEELATDAMPVRDWLLNKVGPDGHTPLELLELGMFDRAARMSVELVDATGASARLPVERELTFGADDEWELDSDGVE